ncbi:hypothetical protein [Parapedobacter koreensis]|uniref:SusD family protein n=1 Tax=Parapedobacter koreensis TaxID=332977 RepID=A0A1H7UGE4_9SPHI|nr:hypothetical protein [Parapedobacter koreensis]SEL96031.1 hypothetical protein SAMN05421740_11558 [Parapedobacter koreensis]
MKKYSYYLVPLILMASCESIGFDDPSTLTNAEAIQKIKSLGYVLTTSSVQTAFETTTNNAGGSHFSLWADQSTNTNGSQSWWDFANEPRLRLNNNAAYRGNAAVREVYSNFYQANLDATKVIDIIENQQVRIYDDAGADRTADCLVGAYYAKGISQGYLGVIFDRGIIVDDVSLSVREFPHSYKDLIENGIAHLDKTLQLVEATPDLRFDFLTGITISRDDLIRLTNSMAARILSSVARDQAEAEGLGDAYWNRVLGYASRGFTTDFLITTVVGGYYNALVDVLERPYGGATYVPVDIKIPYLVDKNHTTPNSYPVDNSIILGPIETDDGRFYTYFAYTSNFGILLEARGRNLFSNYVRTRWMYPALSTLNVAGASNPYFLAEELRLLRAEAKYWLRDYAGAAAELNATSAARKAKGGLPDIAPNPADLRDALHYEYAIEIDAAGGTFVPFTFMRRHDLLQGGTPTQFPVPQIQLELIGLDTYTFGGKDYAGERGIYGELATANDNGWKRSP